MENQQRYTKITAYRSIPYNIQLQKKTGNINTNSKTKTYIIAIHQYAKFYHTETEKLVWCVMHNKHHVIMKNEKFARFFKYHADGDDKL